MDFYSLANAFLDIAKNSRIPYEERLVKNTAGKDWEVDTVLVLDRDWKYETAVRKEGFRYGKWIVVAGVDDKEEAIKKHDIWCALMDSDIDMITDVYTGKVFKRS